LHQAGTNGGLPLLGVAFLGLISLAGCEVGPDYRAPAAERQTGVVAATQTTDAEAAGIASGRPVEREWWLTLKDPKLTALIATAVDENLDLKTASARVREARGLRGVAGGLLYPQITADGEVGVSTTNAGTRATEHQFHGSIAYNAGVGSNATGIGSVWQIDVFGGIRRGIEAADANLEFAVESRRDVLVVLLSEIGTSYAQLRGQQRQLAIARRNVALQEKTLQLEITLKKSGLASELQVAQAETQAETTRSAVPTLEAGVANSIYALGVLLGREPGALAPELSPAGLALVVPPTLPVGLPSDLLLRRPDIRKAEKSMAAASAQIGVAKADLYPKFALTGSLSYSSPGGLAGLPAYFGGPTVSWPIFNGFQITNNIFVQDARLEEAVLGYRSAVLAALLDVETSLTNYAKELVRRDTLAKAARGAERAAALAETQYKNGLVDFLNVLTAEGTQAQNELALAVSEQTLLTDLVAVYKALGGGWETFDEKLVKREDEEPSTELPK
jgi:NodT family efflux transporter outer membrane factor (OMF) lipoprotein